MASSSHNNKFNIVKKSNTLVASRSRLTANEQKLILIAASEIKREDDTIKIYKFNYRLLSELMGLGPHNHMYLEDLTNSLRSKSVQLRDNPDLQVNWLASAEYKNGIVELEFSQKLKPYLLALKDNFTAYQLRNVLALGSGHSIRIYELLKQYEKIGWRSWVSLIDFKLDIGLSEEMYTMYSELKRRILLPAQQELLNSTDITFNFEEIKTSRKVTGIKFFIKSQRNNFEKEEQIPDNKDIKQPDLTAGGIKYTFESYDIYLSYKNAENLAKIIEQMGLSVEDVLQVVSKLSDKQKNGDITKPVAYLLKDPESIIRDILVQPSLFKENKWSSEKYKFYA